MFSDVILVIIGLLIIIGSALGLTFFSLDAKIFYLISGITLAILLFVLYIRNYKDSNYGSKFKERYPNAK